MEHIPFPDKKYQIIYADPPWTHSSWKNGNRRPELHYDVMTIDKIKNLPIRDISDGNCWLFMWTTAPHLKEAFDVIENWGFEYKTIAFNWVKENKKANSLFWGCGSYTRANSEFCLLAKRGTIKRISASVHSVIISKIQEHSKKPYEARKRILELCGDLPRIELFARNKTEGWDAIGNDIDGMDIIKSLELLAQNINK